MKIGFKKMILEYLGNYIQNLEQKWQFSAVYTFKIHFKKIIFTVAFCFAFLQKDSWTVFRTRKYLVKHLAKDAAVRNKDKMYHMLTGML